MPSLQDAISSLHQIAVIEKKSTSTIRLQQLAAYCAQELERRGLTGAESEIEIPGGGRSKQWDVAWKCHEKYRLVISLKSILRNPGGTVPNRIDDLMGETTNVQMYSPEIVVGYLMIFDIAVDQHAPKHGMTWCELLSRRLQQLSGRKAPSWSVGMVEASTIVRVDFSAGPNLLTPVGDLDSFFDTLVEQVRARNPSVS